MKSWDQKRRRHILFGVKLFLAAMVISLGATAGKEPGTPPAGGGDFAGENGSW
jgi:hypothetical protein